MVKSSPTTLFPDAATASSRVPTKQEENACRDNKSKSTSENNEIGGTIRSLKKLLVRGGGGGGSSGGRDGKSTTAATTTTSDKKTMMMIDKQSEHTATETTMVWEDDDADEEEEEEGTETTIDIVDDDMNVVGVISKAAVNNMKRLKSKAEADKAEAKPKSSSLQNKKEKDQEDESRDEGPACYLVYEPDSSGRLVEHYSLAKVGGAVGKWTPGPGKKIASFKLKRNVGRNVLIGQCSAGVQGRKNYCNGWCQFVKSAFVMNGGSVQLWDPSEGLKGLAVDVYMYFDTNDPKDQTVKVEQGGQPIPTTKLLAVACLPKNTDFFEHMTVPLSKWLQEARDHGYSTKI
mmetsp:Transcript_56002/g.135496  ORF Transcript_56002/g.135496 Transcript_56002/m.135496 type:complete len:346 (-) Transcript_56002:4614-5651(-)